MSDMQVLRILLACASPMAADIHRLAIIPRSVKPNDLDPLFRQLVSRLQGELKITIVNIQKDGGRILFDLSSPLPDLDYLTTQCRSVEGVADVSCEAMLGAIDVHRPERSLRRY